jgi:hypothetical protein
MIVTKHQIAGFFFDFLVVFLILLAAIEFLLGSPFVLLVSISASLALLYAVSRLLLKMAVG